VPTRVLDETQDACHKEWDCVDRNWPGEELNGQDTHICAVTREKDN